MLLAQKTKQENNRTSIPEFKCAYCLSYAFDFCCLQKTKKMEHTFNQSVDSEDSGFDHEGNTSAIIKLFLV